MLLVMNNPSPIPLEFRLLGLKVLKAWPNFSILSSSIPIPLSIIMNLIRS